MYYLFLATRLILTLIPQNGYIHPDEFFQSTEILGGKLLNVENHLTWEFNSTSPIRSMTIQYFTIGISFKIYQGIEYILKICSTYTIYGSYFTLLFPRLLMCFSSYLVDYCLSQICSNNNEKSESRQLILASSYVILTYATRTFSNSIELILFSLLLYYVSESLTFSNIVVKRKDYVKYRYEHSKTTVEKAKFHKLNLFLKQDLLRNAAKISTIVVLGCFNRPTFVAFSIVPVFFWLYRGLGSKTLSTINFHYRIIVFLLWTIPSLIFVIICDSFFFGFITWGEVGVLDVSINNFVFTPLNFLRYNLNFANLGKHGTHPRYLNLLVNMPLLFTVLAFLNLVAIFEYFQWLVNSKYNLLPSIRSIKGLMTLSIIAPLLILSYFPHQEPRFLIPLLLPMVYLYGPSILPEKEYDITTPQPGIKPSVVKTTGKKLYCIWIISNLIFVIIYGFLHQGGIIPLVNYLSKTVNTHSYTHIITSHTYMVPKHLVLVPKKDKKLDFNEEKDIHLSFYEEGANPLDKTLNRIENIFKIQEQYNQKIRHDIFKSRVYLVLPNSLKYELNEMVQNRSVRLKEIKTFYPHISLESLRLIVDKLHLFHYSYLNYNNFLKYLFIDLSNFSLDNFWGLSLYYVY